MEGNWRLWGLVGLGAAAVGVFYTGVYYMSFRRGFSRGRRYYSGKSYDRASDPVTKYLIEHNVEDPILKRLRDFTLTLPNGKMMSPVEEGNLLTILCKAIKARKVIDIGVFTGCSAYAMALGLPAGGKVVACDVNMEDAMRGQPYWEDGGVAGKIDLRIQPATDSLQELIDNGEEGSYDLVFVDADKQRYPTYYDFALKLLRPGGLVVIDNALGFGPSNKVFDSNCNNAGVNQVRAVNRMMKEDEKIDYVLLDIGEGVGIGFKK